MKIINVDKKTFDNLFCDTLNSPLLIPAILFSMAYTLQTCIARKRYPHTCRPGCCSLSTTSVACLCNHKNEMRWDERSGGERGLLVWVEKGGKLFVSRNLRTKYCSWVARRIKSYKHLAFTHFHISTKHQVFSQTSSGRVLHNFGAHCDKLQQN